MFTKVLKTTDRSVAEKGKRILRIGKRILLCYLVYFAVCVLIPPLFQKTGAETGGYAEAAGFGGERILCLEDNESALLWRLRMIESAEKEIILASFDFRDDSSGQEVMAALLSAADRGVHIRILVDGLSGARLKYNEHFRSLAAMANVEAKFYNPINLLKPWTLNYRMHDKYLIVDDTAYLLGGRNTYDLFLGSYADHYNIDRDVLVYESERGTDSSLSQLQSYFTDVWSQKSNQSLTVHAARAVTKAQEDLRRKGDELKERFPEAYGPFDWERETVQANDIYLLSNGVTPGNKEPRLWRQLVSLMMSGTDIRIQTPYIICNQAMYEDLEAVCGRAETVQIMTNAVENGANPFGCTDYLNQKDRILDAGAGVAEWMGEQSLHTKTVLIDDALCVIGSYNLDMRSTYLDTELMLVIDCPELNRQLRAGFEEMTEQSRIVSPDGSTKLGERCSPVELSFWKTCIYRILQIGLRPVRHLL